MAERYFKPTGPVFKVCPWGLLQCSISNDKECPVRVMLNKASSNGQLSPAEYKKIAETERSKCIHGVTISKAEYDHRRHGQMVSMI